MYFLNPSDDNLEQLQQNFPADSPLFMLNLLRFNEQANYQASDDAEPCSGLEAYMRYGEGVGPLLEKAGAEPTWFGQQNTMVIGPQDKDWNQVILVRYPDVQAFLNMVTSEDYQAIKHHRTAALLDSRLIALQEF